MRTSAPRRFVIVGLLGLGVVGIGGACSQESTPQRGTGGGSAGGTGGRGSGGAGTGTGTGGASTATGGASTGSSGGSGPTDGGATASVAYTFDTTVQGFGLNGYVPTAPQINLAAPDAGSSPTLLWDGTDGTPAPGSLKLTATFTNYRQFVDVVVGPVPPLNLAGKTIHAKVRLNSGTFATGMGATLHASTGATFAYGGGAYTSLVAGTWTDLTLNLASVTAAMWDPAMVVQIGIQFYSGDPGDAGAFPGPIDVVIQIDSITDGVASGGGTDGGATGDGGDAAATAGLAYNFDIAAQGFVYNSYTPTPPQRNLASPDGGSAPTLLFDAVEGSPTPGSLRANVTFTDYRQFVDVVVGPSPALDLTGKTLHAKVRLTSGTFGAGAGATLHVGTGAGFVYGAGAYTPLVLGAWTDLTLSLSTVTTAMWNPAMVVQIGVQLYSGDPPDGGTFVGPNDVVFHIDSITE